MFQPTPFLKESVENKDLDMIRGALIGILQADPATKTHKLENGIRYAESYGINVFEEEMNPKYQINNNKDEWDSRYFARALAYLSNNFTKERLLHAIEVGRATHQEQYNADEPIQKPKTTPHNNESKQKTSGTTQRRTEPDQNWISATLIAGGAIAALLLYLLFKK